MNIDTFRQMYVTELQELYSVETQLTEALPKMLDTARRVELKQVIRDHLQETARNGIGSRSFCVGTKPRCTSMSINRWRQLFAKPTNGRK